MAAVLAPAAVAPEAAAADAEVAAAACVAADRTAAALGHGAAASALDWRVIELARLFGRPLVASWKWAGRAPAALLLL